VGGAATGDAWVASGASAVLRVPSAIVAAAEWNYLLNPAHPDLPKVKVGKAVSFRFDRRLLG
jgi:RES domain-containing protein